ncbi:MAG: Fic/DOC family N-terminal domain-containing protein [Reichenbachiella sp.]|uniref:Fic family protein n=1 Tax=Reichenbachiella sp. TaxID=2184521 RepID=UPI003266AE10
MAVKYAINPDRNKPWNDMPLFPIDKENYHNLEIYEALVESKAALARLQGRSATLSNQGVLISTISLQEAKASSAIENIFTTDDELYKAYSETDQKPIFGPPKEVLRYREALWQGHAYMKGKKEFDQGYLDLVYQTIKEANDSIRSPFSQIVIRQGGSELNTGQVIYTPPRGKGVLENQLSNLLEFLNDDQKYPVDPLMKMVMGHFQFEAIHPYRDGNGRTGRIFNIHYLTHIGLLDFPILFLSKFIIQNKDEYYGCLAGVSQRGDWKKWILYMLKAVELTSNDTYNKINEILSVKDEILEELQKNSSIRRPELLVEIIFTQPYTKVKHLTDKKAFAENTARNYLNELCDLQVLEKRTIEGHHYYLNLELYRILSN